MFLILFLWYLLASIPNYNCLNSTYDINKIIEVPSVRSHLYTKSDSNRRPWHFYERYQNSDFYYHSLSGITFTRVPGLYLTTHHVVPIICRLRLHISIAVMKQGTHAMVQFLLNDRVLMANKLYPNNDQRMRNQNVWRNTVIGLDFQGGGMSNSGSAESISFPHSKTAVLLIPPGTHLIEVGVRTEEAPLHLHGGELQVEMTEYDPNLHIGLEYPQIVTGH